MSIRIDSGLFFHLHIKNDCTFAIRKKLKDMSTAVMTARAKRASFMPIKKERFTEIEKNKKPPPWLEGRELVEDPFNLK